MEQSLIVQEDVERALNVTLKRRDTTVLLCYS